MHWYFQIECIMIPHILTFCWKNTIIYRQFNKINKNAVWKVADWVDEKGIRFESGTTAITVFDDVKAECRQRLPKGRAFCAAVPLYHKSGYLPCFLGFTQTLAMKSTTGLLTSHRKNVFERYWLLWSVLFMCRHMLGAWLINLLCFPISYGEAFFVLKKVSLRRK